jgi:hypothetical protein
MHSEIVQIPIQDNIFTLSYFLKMLSSLFAQLFEPMKHNKDMKFSPILNIILFKFKNHFTEIPSDSNIQKRVCL